MQHYHNIIYHIWIKLPWSCLEISRVKFLTKSGEIIGGSHSHVEIQAGNNWKKFIKFWSSSRYQTLCDVIAITVSLLWPLSYKISCQEQVYFFLLSTSVAYWSEKCTSITNVHGLIPAGGSIAVDFFLNCSWFKPQIDEISAYL